MGLNSKLTVGSVKRCKRQGSRKNKLKQALIDYTVPFDPVTQCKQCVKIALNKKNNIAPPHKEHNHRCPNSIYYEKGKETVRVKINQAYNPMVNFAYVATLQQQVSQQLWLQMQYAAAQQQQQAHTYTYLLAAANQQISQPFHNRPGPADCCLGDGTY